MPDFKVAHTIVSEGQCDLACASVENSFAAAGVPGVVGVGLAVVVGTAAGLVGGAVAVGLVGAGAAGAAVGAAGAAVGAGGGAGGADGAAVVCVDAEVPVRHWSTYARSVTPLA
jgi:hypothetical protein